MRNLLLLLTTACLGMLPLSAATLTLAPSPSTPFVGSNFQLNLVLPPLLTIGHSDLYAYSIDLQFDPTALAAVSVTEGPFLSTGGSTFFFEGNIDNSVGLISNISASLLGATTGANASCINLNCDIAAGGVLFTVTFQALTLTPSTISLQNLLFQDYSDVNNFTADVLGTNNVTIADAFVQPTAPPAVPEPSSFFLLGSSLAGALYFVRRHQQRKA